MQIFEIPCIWVHTDENQAFKWILRWACIVLDGFKTAQNKSNLRAGSEWKWAIACRTLWQSSNLWAPNKAFSLHSFGENEKFSYLQRQRSQTGDRWKCRETRRCPLSKKGRGAMYSIHTIHNTQYIVHVILHICHRYNIHTYVYRILTCKWKNAKSQWY